MKVAFIGQVNIPLNVSTPKKRKEKNHNSLPLAKYDGDEKEKK